jgi:hypothetical protein
MTDECLVGEKIVAVTLIQMEGRIGGVVVTSSAEGPSPRFGVHNSSFVASRITREFSVRMATGGGQGGQGGQGGRGGRGARSQARIERSALVRHTLDWATSAATG